MKKHVTFKVLLGFWFRGVLLLVRGTEIRVLTETQTPRPCKTSV